MEVENTPPLLTCAMHTRRVNVIHVISISMYHTICIQMAFLIFLWEIQTNLQQNV